ncbi:LysM peptidoglycan-binding domain-containing protein [Liquorilactobacillus mali]|uniref:LysM peptidoglycan-binding domain-containing protein n=1 Tax=Liquorilactobacillus mali TaxID=1618 RepID=UPI00024930D3|nr:LysM peptidoglycan-binding domain-containing protein [Liquorilactobacillus mali]EJE97420.1 LysM-domain containing protein/autolysin [Liquorilactobacillus mali KCTC 3596 = DSM 20444]MDC7953084.1 LysM peptidoglycan-binding domain-containing protein [Liquorilactobacillus mali]MDV7757322.1 LysM peptidoglycan-binding domain-containing protein [Liquorilactobacillus mali]QFQ75255.1 LysM peptidoglycan-binding domain-containing protein [Liquorilactobacillus mali]
MARRRSHTKTNKKVLWSLVTIIIVVVICVLGSTSEFVRNKLTSVFSDNVKSQKVEYKKQQSIAQEKYGKTSETTSESKQQSSTAGDSASNKSNSSESSKKSSVTASSEETDSTASTASSTYKRYVVESGDTLSSIASRYGTTVTRLMSINDLSTGTISAGTTLRIPASTASSSTASSSTSDSD